MTETPRNRAGDEIQGRLADRTDDGGEAEYELLTRLNHLLDRQREAGDHKAALVTARRALRQARLLPSRYRLAVATALQALREELVAGEMWDEARQVAAETVQAYAVLGEEDPDLRFWHALALDGMAGIDLTLGDPAGALELVLTSTGIYRRLAQDDPGAHGPELLRSLHNLRHVYRRLGRTGAAAGAMRQAVRLCREAGDGDPGWTPKLARALDCLGRDLEESGQAEAAVPVLEESAALYEECPDSEELRADVLARLGIHLNATGRGAEAVEAATAATALLRGIGAPSRLATALHDLGIGLQGVGRAEEAVEAAREAVEILQRLYDEDPGRAAGLATALGYLGLLREERRQFEHAVTSGERAVSLLERLHACGHTDHDHELAQALRHLGRYHERLGRPEQAFACLERALTLYGELTRRDPDRFRTGLADAWVAQSVYLALLERPEEAVAAAQLAVDLYDGACPTGPDHRAGTAEALSHLGDRAANAGQRERAVRAMTRAVDLYEDLVSLDPGLYVSKLADELDGLAVRHCERGDHDRALPLLERAAVIWRELGSDAELAVTLRRKVFALSCLHRDTGEAADRLLETAADPVDAFTALGEQLIGAGRREAALEHLTRAATLWEITSFQQPDASVASYARTLGLMASCLEDVLRLDEAVAAQRRTVELLTAVVDEEPEHLPLLSWALGELAGYLCRTGCPEEALGHRRQAVEIDNRLATRDPTLYRRALAGSLTGLGHLLEDLGEQAEAEEVLARAHLLSATLPDAEQAP
ncbi:tetratricopeptide repeat protein [Streptosporangium sp. CA-135522]|uniref:tetratricopeptide repeat protein n=1 Tax=Streptosporangium sp. CA-135522 TaxID=3240072 RepID=UPI003D9194D3